MTDDRAPDMDDMDPMAAELALGLLDGDDRAAALRRVIADPEFAAQVERWRDHFAVLFDLTGDVAPPARTLERIERALSPPANDDQPQRGATGPWRGIAAFSSVAAAVLLGLLVVRPSPPPAPPVIASAQPVHLLVTVLAPADKSQPVPAFFDPQLGQLRVSQASLVDQGHSAELWVIPRDGTPVSLGLLDGRQDRTLSISQAQKGHFVAGSTLAVTIEPLGGSPTGKPTGAILASGELQQL